MRQQNPRIASCFALYLECRSLTYVHVPINKDKGKKVEHKILQFANGWSHLPDPGGVLDQGVWTMAMFQTFRRGENLGVKEEL